jgi:hypothetical protein
VVALPGLYLRLATLEKSAWNTICVASVRKVVTSARNCSRSASDGMLPWCFRFTRLWFIRRIAGLRGISTLLCVLISPKYPLKLTPCERFTLRCSAARSKNISTASWNDRSAREDRGAGRATCSSPSV